MKKTFRKNEIYTVKIEDLTDLGFGVAHIDGAAAFVADTVPGDTVRIKLIKVNSSYLVGRVEEYVEKSPTRCVRCGERLCRSCAYKSISYTDEALLKEEGVQRLFSHPSVGALAVAPITKSPSELRYRNKAQYPISKGKDGFAVGFYAPKSHRVTPVEDCPLTPGVFSEICVCLCRLFDELDLSVYDEESKSGLLRHIYLRRGEVSGEILLTIVVTSFNFPGKECIAKNISCDFPGIVGVLLNKNDRDTNVVLGEEYMTLSGRDYIYDTLAGVRLKITAQSFYQVNHSAAELLYAKARELACLSSDDVLLDLFCGAGSIGLSMAKDVKELIGVEIVESAVLAARENAASNGITNARFYSGDATETERLLSNAEREIGHPIKPDVIILDPPRGGCDERLVRFTASLAPKRIVYISCNPKTLARDVSLYRELGYLADTVYPFDLFPMTGHVESLVCLTRQTN